MNSTNPCAEMELLLQADIDGELSAAQAAAVTVHRVACEHCATIYRELLELKQSLRAELTRHTPAPEFRALMQNKMAAELKRESPSSFKRLAEQKVVGYKRSIVSFGGGVALAASVMLFVLNSSQQPLVDAVVAGHIRSLQPGHLLDVESNDQHNVKPWFDGRLDFSPPVKNFGTQGFPLVGGRLDYLNGREVAALIYQRGKHAINVFVWPETADKAANFASGFKIRNGYNVYEWQQGGMVLWLVSDLNQSELSEFLSLWNSTAL